MADTGADWPEVIVPVHNGADVLAACLDALAAHLPAGASLQIVDDASSCPRTVALLERFEWPAGLKPVRHRNPRNLGFVASVNAAMARTRSDVVLLNSDTRVTPGWLQALRDCARSDARIATATPWSNNAEICSLPCFVRASAIPADLDSLAQALAALAPNYPDLPTAVGFCMYIRRAALDRLGDFDAATFGLGYGEENDFCLRACAHGWRNVLCDNAYVAHVGGVSFSAQGLKPGGENLDRLLARYPHYNRLIADFIQRDPLAVHRQRVLVQLASAGIQLPEPDQRDH